MASRRDCSKAIREQFAKEIEAGKITDKEIRRIVKDLEGIRESVFAGPDSLKEPVFREQVMESLRRQRYQYEARARARVQDAIKLARNVEESTQKAFENNPVEGLLAQTVGGTTQFSKGGNFGAATHAQALRSSWTQQLWAKMEETGVYKLIENKLVSSREIAQEVWELRSGGSPGSTGSNEAAQAAQAIKTQNKLIFRAKQEAGSLVQELDDFITHTSHQADKVYEAGFEKWYEFTRPLIDAGRTFGVMPEAEAKEAMEEVWKSIVTGDYRVRPETATSNVAERQAIHREMHFLDGNSWYDYNAKFGVSDMLHAVQMDISRSAKDVALMYRFGSNPEQGFNKVWEATKRRVAENRPAYQKLEENEGYIRAAFRTAQGLSDIPGSGLGARIGQRIRTWESLTKLGSALFSSFGDFASSISVARLLSGGTMLHEAAEVGGNYLKAFGSSAERKAAARALELTIEDMQGELWSRYGAASAEPGKLTKAMTIMSKLNLMDNHVGAAKVALATRAAEVVAEHSNASWDMLPSHLKANLERYGIDDKLWQHLRKGVERTENGRLLVTPEGIRNIQDSTFQPDTQFELTSKYLAYLNDHANIASSTPGAREKLFLLRGSRDEGLGVLARLFAQFKSPAVMAVNTGRRVLMSNAETLPRSLKDLSGGDYARLAQHAALMITFGYVANSMRAVAEGKTPPDPTHFKSYVDAVQRSGVAGLYGDFLLSEVRRNGVGGSMRTFVGPGLGDGFTLLDLMRKSAQGDAKAGEWVNFIQGNVPGQNLFWTKGAMNYLIWNNLKSDASLRATERNVRQDGQGYFIDQFRPTQGVGK